MNKRVSFYKKMEQAQRQPEAAFYIMPSLQPHKNKYKMNSIKISALLFLISFSLQLNAQEDRGYKIYQFEANNMPRIDGDASDWQQFPDEYCIDATHLIEDEFKKQIDTTNLNVKVRVAWVKGFNRLYFLYEAYDNFWDFSGTGLRNDTYEIVVDGDMSGGPFVNKFHPNKAVNKWDAYFNFHGNHAQNYHIFTPAKDKSWCMYWGPQQWLKEMPYANAAYNYDFKHGEAGKLTLEFWVSVYDHADTDPNKSVASVFADHKKIGLAWAIIDYDANTEKKNGFWNLSKHHTMYGQASQLLAFELMPLISKNKPTLKANWTHTLVNENSRLVAFTDKSQGEITNWHWDFGDGNTSSKKNPIHNYTAAGHYVVTLKVEGPEGKSKFSRVWDVSLK